ncbi:MAG TPA: hypothetical protein ENN80_08320 [Candidatus Hydrogenedentes bacterium]|nr:hypothetical protein [Candidatus Hydrogenedentota bacterium]
MKRFVRSIITAVCIAGAVQVLAVGVLAPRLPPVRGRPATVEEREFRLGAAPELRLHNHEGSVHVRTHDGDETLVRAEVRAYIYGPGSASAARAYAASVVRVQESAEAVDVISEPAERPDGVDVEVDYDVFVPEGTDVVIEGGNGNVWVSKGCGQVSVRGRNADIEIVKPRGPVTVRSKNGRIRVLDAEADTDIETVNGNIYAHMRRGALRAVTTNGAIVAHMYSADSPRFELESQNGGLTLVMSEGCSGRVEARTGRGIVRSDFPVDMADGVLRRRHLQGTIGAGHTAVSMHTLNGNIWLTKE